MTKLSPKNRSNIKSRIAALNRRGFDTEQILGGAVVVIVAGFIRHRPRGQSLTPRIHRDRAGALDRHCSTRPSSRRTLSSSLCLDGRRRRPAQRNRRRDHRRPSVHRVSGESVVLSLSLENEILPLNTDVVHTSQCKMASRPPVALWEIVKGQQRFVHRIVNIIGVVYFYSTINRTRMHSGET